MSGAGSYPERLKMLLLSQTTEYALRAMAHLAANSTETAVTASELAEASGIPTHYVSKVMRRLVVAGLCSAQRGHHGGFALARAPSEIRFSEIIEAADPDHASLGCAFGYARCDLKCPCPLHESWAPLKDQFAAWAKRTTLEEVRVYALRPEVKRKPAMR
jgi:Rrf2 family protein